MNTPPAVNDPLVEARKRKLIIRMVVAAAVLILAIVVLVSNRWTAPWAAGLAALCLLAKEVFTAFAREEGLPSGWKLQDWAAIASLYAVVFGAPAVVTSIV